MRIAQILYDKVHYIFESDTMPSWPPDAEGRSIELVDISNKPEINEGWEYDKGTGEFSAPAIEVMESVGENE